MKHWVRFYFPFSFAQDADINAQAAVLKTIQSLSLTDVANALELPVIHTEKFNQCDTSIPIWQPAQYKTDPRFDDHLHKIFNGRSTATQQDNKALPLCLALSTEGVNWLNGGKPGQQGAGINVRLPNSSVQRLSEQQIIAPVDKVRTWPLQLSEIWCVIFNTGIGVCIVEVAYQSPGKKPHYAIQSPLEIQELNYHLARNKQNKQTLPLCWAANADKETTPVLGLAGIVNHLLPPLKNTYDTQSLKSLHWESTYTYTVAEVDDSTDDENFRQQAFRLARKYTDAYIPSSGQFANSEYRFFDNLVHHFALEGCCTLIRLSPNSPEAITQFAQTACRMAYEPIVTLVYSEMVFLRAMTQGSNIDIDLRNPNEQELEQLRHYRTRLYNYRLNSRFAYVSGLTLHNDFFQHLRNTFNIDSLLKELSTDVEEIEAFISMHLEEKNQRSLNKVKLLGSLFAALVLLTDLTGLNLHTLFFSSPPVPPIMRGLFWGALGAIIFGFVTTLKPKK
nr:hypothetical protein [uncultured Shewanella sp.]